MCVQILDEMPVFYNLSTIEKREVLIIFLQIVRNLDDETLIKAWEQSIARTRLFFKLLEECLMHFEVEIWTAKSLNIQNTFSLKLRFHVHLTTRVVASLKRFR